MRDAAGPSQPGAQATGVFAGGGWVRRLTAGLVGLSLFLPAVVGLSCADDTRPALADFDTPAGPPKSLRETFDYLRAAQSRKAYLALRPYIDPQARDEVIDLLLAMDGLLTSNAAVLKAVERVCPDTPRERIIDVGDMADNLELFSREVEVIRQEEDRDRGEGTIVIEIAQTPPLARVQFRLRDGHWVYAPGQGGAPYIQALRDLTAALDRVTRSLSISDRVTPEQVGYKYQLFVAPKLRQNAALATAAR